MRETDSPGPSSSGALASGFLTAGLCGIASFGSADMLELKVTADASICCHRSEQDLNAGGGHKLKMKGIENVIVLDFDPAPLAGRRVKRAVLSLRGAGEDLMVRKVGLSSVAARWREGKKNYERASLGEACFLWPGGGTSWAGRYSDFTGALWGRGGTFWTRAIARETRPGFYEIDVDGRLLEARAAGLSHGLALSDDNGQTMLVGREVDPDSNRGNNFFFARESGRKGPRLKVELSPVSAPALRDLTVSVSVWPGGGHFKAGGALVSWPGPRDVKEAEAILGYRVRISAGGKPFKALKRWEHPPVPAPGKRVSAFVPDLPSRSGVTAEVEVVGRGGVALARGQGAGFASPQAKWPKRVRLDATRLSPGPLAGTGASFVWAVPDLAKVNPITGNVLEDPGIAYEGPQAGSWRRANPAWDGKERAVHLSGLPGEWVAFQLVCENRYAAAAAYRVTVRDMRAKSGVEIPSGEFRLYRAWYQRAGESARGWYADPLLPLTDGEQFLVPDERNAVPGQMNQTIYTELFIPRKAKVGRYAGVIEVEVGGETAAVKILLDVGKGAIPQKANFTWSLNAYNSPGYGFGEAMSERFLRAEREFYALAHEHRATLAILHYSHSGNYAPAAAPPVTGKGSAARVKDWAEWDRRFGPLLDGTVFKATRRPNAPLEHFYLVFSEHYPTSMADGYKWNSLKWEDHWREAGDIEEGFGEEYRETWKAVARDYLKRIRAKGWKTRFHVYLNDKYFYKMYDPKKGKRGRGVSFWLLDEPQHVDDFLALRFFGRLLREVQEGERESLIYRVDLSRPEWGRDTLEDLIDLNVTGGFYKHPRLLKAWRERYGHAIWTYGDSPHSSRSAHGYRAQALDLYARGADGYVPWLVLGGEENWEKFATTCVIYTGKPFGIEGACPSIRLKAMRRAEQDVEYLVLLAEKRGVSAKADPHRYGMAALLHGVVDALKHTGLLDAHGTVTETYDAPPPGRVDAFRRAVMRELASRSGGKK